MLESLNKIINNAPVLQKELARYDLPGVTNIAALSRVKKAYLSAAEYIKTEQDLIDCKTGFYGSLQKIKRLGIDLNDTDLWFINTYKKDIKAEYVYQALLKSAARRGYPCFPTFEYIFPEEKFATYYGENQRIMIDYRDEGLQKEITLENLTSYKLFFLLLNIKREGKLIHQEKVTLSPAEIIKHKNMSKTKDKGESTKRWNNKTKSYDIAEKNTESVWQLWTKPMIQKTLILRAFSIIKNVLPDLGEIFQFEDLEEPIININTTTPVEGKPFIQKSNNIDLPSEELLKEVKKIKEEYEITPELIDYNKKRIMEAIEVSRTIEQIDIVINLEAPTILSLGNDFIFKVKNARQAVSAS